MVRKTSKSKSAHRDKVVGLVKMDAPILKTFEVPSDFVRIFELVGAKDVLTYLRDTYNAASRLTAAFHSCTDFEFYEDKVAMKRSSVPDNPEAFWIQVNILLVFAAKSASHTVHNLIDGMVTCIRAFNELSSALVIRAFLEHACALNHIQLSLEQSSVNRGKRRFQVTKTKEPEDSDRSLYHTLMEYALGKCTNIANGDLERSFANAQEFDAFLKHNSKTKGYSSPRIGTFIKEAAIDDKGRIMRLAYELLCEYCHPNSRSRNYGYDVWLRNSSGKTQSTEIVQFDNELKSGLTKILEIARYAVPAVCKMVTESLETISDSIGPVPKVQYVGSDGTVPSDYDFFRNDFGQLTWAPLSSVTPSPAAVSSITEAQKKNISTIYYIFLDVQNWSLEECIAGFSRDAVGVDQEIDLWLMMAEIYVQECADRGDPDLKEKKAIFNA